jgi:transcriptional antiterminator NusG
VDAEVAGAEPEAAGVAPRPEVPADPTRGWYVIHTYSGYENKVKANIEKRVKSMGKQDQIFGVLVPEEEQIEVGKDGKRKTVKTKIYPGYVLVDMQFTEDSWFVVRNTPGVTGFVSSGNRPRPLLPEEVEGIQARIGVAEERPRPRIEVEVGQNIRVRSGAFDGFIGVIDAIDEAKGKLRVLISMFGRETPLELDFDQVERI